MESYEEGQGSREQTALNRIIALSDGIFAIAITLLALNIDVPNLPADRSDELPGELAAMWPEYVGYVIAFLVIGVYWVAHHRMFRYIVRYDDAFIWLNLLFLMAIAFLPFLNGLLGEYPEQQVVVVIYAAVLTVTGLLSTAMWRYAAGGHRLIRRDVDRRLINYFTVRGLIPPTTFALSIGLSFISPRLAVFSWALITLASRPVLYWLRRSYISTPTGR